MDGLQLPKAYALVPAAGSGIRMGGVVPKQYLEIEGRPLLHYALKALADCRAIEHVFVVLAPDDTRFRRHDWSALGKRLTPLYCGGETRAASVFNGLLAARDAIGASDWVLVHDAARPCLGQDALGRLLAVLKDEEVGGLLAIPLADTLKRATREERVAQTEPRDHLWLAQTPQMFRYRLLVEALRAADPSSITDEASAIEALGLKPRLVMGDTRNIKVTYPEDLELAQWMVAGRGRKAARARPRPRQRAAGRGTRRRRRA